MLVCEQFVARSSGQNLLHLGAEFISELAELEKGAASATYLLRETKISFTG